MPNIVLRMCPVEFEIERCYFKVNFLPNSILASRMLCARDFPRKLNIKVKYCVDDAIPGIMFWFYFFQPINHLAYLLLSFSSTHYLDLCFVFVWLSPLDGYRQFFAMHIADGTCAPESWLSILEYPAHLSHRIPGSPSSVMAAAHNVTLDFKSDG